MTKKIYQIRTFTSSKKKVYGIFRPDGSKVNDTHYQNYKLAKAKLDVLVALGYCLAQEN